MSSNKKYNITENKKIDSVSNIPSYGNSIIYPKIDNYWYTMGSDGIEVRLGGDVLFNRGFIQSFGDYSPYNSSVELDLGYGLTYSDNKIVVDPLSVQLEDQNNKFMYIDFSVYVDPPPPPWARVVFNQQGTLEYQVNNYLSNNNLVVLDDEIPIFKINVVETGTFASRIHKYTLPHNFGKGDYSPMIDYFTFSDLELIYKDESFSDPNPSDIENDVNNIVFDLGDISGDELYNYVNNYVPTFDISEPGYLYYFKFIIDDITYMYYFDIGSSYSGYGIYGFNNLQFNSGELALFYNSSTINENQSDVANNVGITYDIYLHDISGVSVMDDLTDLKLSNHINSLVDPIVITDVNAPVYFRVYECPYITFFFNDIYDLDGVNNLDSLIQWSNWFNNNNNVTLRYNNGSTNATLDKIEYDSTNNLFRYYSYDFTNNNVSVYFSNNVEARKVMNFEINFIRNFRTLSISYSSLSNIDLDSVRILNYLELGSINLENVYGNIIFSEGTKIQFYNTIQNFDYLNFLKNNVNGGLEELYFIALSNFTELTLYGLSHLESINHIYIYGLTDLTLVNISNLNLSVGFIFDDLYLCDDLTIRDCSLTSSNVEDILDNLDGNGQSNGYLDLRGNEPIGASYSSLINLQNKGWVVHIDLI